MSAPEIATPDTRPLVRIEWVTDEHDCSDCGWSYAEGAVIHIEGREPIEMLPSAHCFDSLNYSGFEVYARVLEELGYRLETEDRANEFEDDHEKYLAADFCEKLGSDDD